MAYIIRPVKKPSDEMMIRVRVVLNLIASGMKVADACRELKMSRDSFYIYRKYVN